MAKKKRAKTEKTELTAEEKLLDEFFGEFRKKCLLAKPEKKKMQADFERAVEYYRSVGVPVEKALQLINIDNLGGFYSRGSAMWYPLDDAAKIYPISMKHGSMTVFRISAYMKKDVVPELLQMALSFTVKRFPGFATTLKKGFFWHYLNTSRSRFSVEEEKGVPLKPISVSRSNSHTFRVLYYKNRISIEFFHVLTDGAGAVEFLKVLVREYLRLSGVDTEPSVTVMDIKEAPSADEFENAFAHVPRAEKASGFVDRPALQMSGKLSSCRPCRVLHFKMKSDVLLSVARKYGTSVTCYLLAVMFLAIKMSCEEMKGEVNIQLPVNMRKFHKTRTVRNFAMYCGIRLPIGKITGKEELIKEIAEQVSEKTSYDEMQKMMTATERLVGSLKLIPLIIKKPLVRLVYAFLGDRLFSTTLSNLGVVSMPPEMEREIDGLDFVLGPSAINRAACALITLGETATLSITKVTADPSFENEIYRLLEDDGIEISAEGSEFYED